MGNRRELLPLAESVADGSAIDWDAAEAQATPSEQALIRQLRALAGLAALHRSLSPDDVEQPLTHPGQRADAAPAIGNWAHLTLLEQLGEGTFGDVYRAWDPQLERAVALKLLRPETSGGQTSQIAREGRLLARIRHPNVVIVHGASVHDQRVGLWMDLIKGATLEQCLLQQGPFSAREASLIGIDLCGALAAIHAAGLIHRDVKAANVMREDGGRIVLMDLGTGREIVATGPNASDLIGTPLYLAPEIFRGTAASVRSDLYSLGILLYHLVTNSYPIRATTIEDLKKGLANGTGVRLRDARADLPAAFVRVVDRAIADDPDRRHESAGALESDLRRTLDRSSERSESPKHSVRRHSSSTPARAVDNTAGHAPSIAVLPFLDINPEKNLEYFCDGITEEIISVLTKIRGLRVTARMSAFEFKRKPQDVRRVGERLNVETVLTGSVRAAGDRMRIITQLSNATTGYQLWSERFECKLEDVFAVQDEIATAVARTLRVQLSTGNLIASPSTTNPEAYTLYLKGRHHWNKRTEESFLKSVACFQEALERDPGYAQAHVGLADAYITLAVYGVLPPGEVMPKARAMAEKALELVHTSPDVSTSLGCVSAMYDWDWLEAGRCFRRAIELSPDYPTAHHWYAINFLVPQQKFSEAQAELRIALELDPLSLAASSSLGMSAYFAHRYPEAIDQLTRTLDLDTGFAFAHFFLGQALAEMSTYDEAVRQLETAIRLSNGSPEMLAGLGYACARAGNVDRARGILGELGALSERRYVAASLIAQVHAGLDDRGAALQWLEKACGERAADIGWLAVRPVFDDLHSEPRFVSLCQRIGVPLESATVRSNGT